MIPLKNAVAISDHVCYNEKKTESVVRWMDRNIESMLMEEHMELYTDILRKGIEEWNLPLQVEDKMVGFGMVLDFYMFWISVRQGVLFFNARKVFTRRKTDNIVRIAFTEENRAEIWNAIDTIYSSYCGDDGAFQREADRMEREAARSGKNGYTPEVMLLWDDAILRVRENAENFSYDEQEIDMDTPRDQAERLMVLFEELLRIMGEKCYPRSRRDYAIYLDHIEGDQVTLSDLASKYELSRERIRQIINRIEERLFRRLKKAMRFDNVEFNACIERIAEILKEANYCIPYLLVYGMSGVSNRKKQALLNLFGENLRKELAESAAGLTTVEWERRMLQKKQEEFEAWRLCSAKVCYPSAFVVDQSLPVAVYERGKLFSFEERAYKQLKKFGPAIEIIQNPDIVYDSTSETDHRPHFLLRLPDGTSALGLILPTVNMAFIYNIKRCNALHLFCKANGYGYLIVDDRGDSMFDLKNRALDPALKERLDVILQTRKRIVWNDILQIKRRLSVSNADIAAYVLQNKLHFTMEPFCIRYRENP